MDRDDVNQLSAGQFPHHSGPPLVRVNRLNHYFGEGEARNQVLTDNNLEVMPGEIVIMTGPSGSGKTTLLTLIGALRSVQEGGLDVLGRDLTKLSPPELVEVRRDIGFIFQAHNLFSSLSAYQNVCMSLQQHAWDPSALKARAEEVLTMLDLGHRIHYKPASLSGGQKQRVAIARALANRPKLILADEPTAALDEKSGRRVVELFQKLVREDGASIFIVTHDNRILDVADRIVNMVGGKIISNILVEESVALCLFLSKCEAFSSLRPAMLTKVAEQMRKEVFQPGANIIRQGEAGDRFYLIRRGLVDVIVDEGKPGEFRKILKEGDFFGEKALLTGEPRSATVRAREPVEAYTLDKAGFNESIAASDSFKQQIYKAYFQRQ
ncbi:MAG: ATP-binding cassette domain-containing protein [Planctomycetes bacterium]|nr:ATP-binding cassette domain-containing protein [Planctomycetota bacterium]